MTAFGGAFSGQRVLLTGHTGFKGSWLARWLQRLGAEVHGLALDPGEGPSHWRMLDLRLASDRRVDLRDADALQSAVRDVGPTIVIHLAAQSLVPQGYADPAGTFAVNVTGLQNLYEALRGSPGLRVVLNATTDKVYREPCPEAGFRETDPLGGHDPYSASKACAEILGECYSALFGDGVVLLTARAGNVIGGGDWTPGRLVPDLVRAVEHRQPLVLRRPEAVRPWQHVLEPLSGYLCLVQQALRTPALRGSWNFGPPAHEACSAIALVAAFRDAGWGVDLSVSPVAFHENPALRLDSAKAAGLLGWRPVWGIGATIARTVAWYTAIANGEGLLTDAQIDAYVADAARAGLAWAATQEPAC